MKEERENWNRAYVEAPEIFDAFCRAEDPDGLMTERLLAAADVAGQTVLEIGCGSGRYTRDWAPGAGFHVALDRAPRLLSLARESLAGAANDTVLLCADASRVPLADGSVDQILAGWVVYNLRPATQKAVLAETSRLLRRGPGAGLWLVENHWTGEFQELRGRSDDAEETRVRQLIDSAGLTLVDVVRTELRFKSEQEAERVLGYLCGESARRKLRERPTASLTHDVVILHRPASPPA
jgi:SAM-dependent methyltransferase